MQWTKEQERIINERNSNILVSAAAGSGKTAVLVERILEKIIDENNPIDIDKFLVVTFTNAAAAQMREKIASKIEKALEENPLNEHLMKQLVLINRADIVTIDSFCLKLVKEHFSMLDIDSTFGIGDTGMMDMLKNDVLDDMFEEKYDEIDNNSNENYYSFFELVDIFSQDKDDSKLKEAILKINNMSDSYPIPENWLIDAKEALMVCTIEELEKTRWVQNIFDITKAKLSDVQKDICFAMDLCDEVGGPTKNKIISESDLEVVNRILACNSYDEFHSALSSVKWDRLKSCKGDEFDEELVEQYKAIRESYKNTVKGIDFFAKSSDKVLEEISSLRKYLIPLICLVEEFRDKLYEVKKQRKMFDFSDIEHMAYKLVCTGNVDENGFCVPTIVGQKISERYEEIFIDEYQDSNYLQEDILCSVSKLYKGIYNMFMVGDVKQSIYRFRMARPDLFLMKYNKYGNSGNEIKIELKNNFRSRKEVLYAANYFFYQLMGKDLGGIDYNNNVALVPSKDYPDRPADIAEESNLNTEIIFCDYLLPEGSKDVLDKISVEAEIIAQRIKELVDEEHGFTIFDDDLQIYRKARYSDIVIISRNMKGFGQTVSNILRDNNIPVHVDDPKGYFNAVEIKLTLSLLRVIDNSRQDIPLSAVLLSPMAALDENELAVICDYANKNTKDLRYLWDKCDYYRISNENPLANKLDRMFDIIGTLKVMKNNMSIQSLIWKALELTGYYTYVKAMPMGKRRKANLDMLLEKTAAFENGYYKGLFNFIRYIDKLEYNNVDFGEAILMDGDENMVRIISMHKSKGLEYPIVFVSGLGKGFNKEDSKKNMIIHSDFYLSGMDFDLLNRMKSNTFIRNAFNTLLKTESIAEEIRILYVALTRAKEKLILTGCDADLDKQFEKLSVACNNGEVLLPYLFRSSPKSFLQMILACMVRYSNGSKIVDGKEMPVIEYKQPTYEDVVSNMVDEASNVSASNFGTKEQADSIPDDDKYKAYKEIVEYEYPYALLTGLKAKMSISEIKKMKAFDGLGFDVAEPEEAKSEGITSEQAKSEGITSEQAKSENVKISDVSGAQRGTIVHKFMELLKFKELLELESYENYLDYVNEYKQHLVEQNIFNDNEIELINSKKVVAMLQSNLGLRMIKADGCNNLYKEQQFSIGINVSDIYTNEELLEGIDDIVIVQGIIDAYFVEDNEIVVMDYKTDNVDEETLVGRYKAQLDYYASTLERLTGKKVKEKIIYSFKHNKEILL